MDNLSMDCMRAKKSGMSYGFWKAEHPYTKTDEIVYPDYGLVHECVWCGKEFWKPHMRKVRYCSGKCQMAHMRAKRREVEE
jgi:hypothetical protein